MTTVRIHGYLSKIFGNAFKINVGSINHIILAIDCVKNGFRKKIIELQSKGYNFSITKNNNIIDIIPIICGASRGFMRIFSVVLVVVGVILIFVPGCQMIGMNLISAGIQIGIAAFFPPKLKFPNRDASVGGATYSSEANGRSYIFSNNDNLASQGSFVPIGYGKFIIGSKIINVSIKNYSTNQTFAQENYFTSSEPESSTFSQVNDQNIIPTF